MRLALSTTLYALAVVLANVLTSRFGMIGAGFGLQVTAGTYAAGFALLARDVVQQTGGIRWALAAVTVGIGLSFLLADPHVALASTVAFGAAELLDLAVFTPLRRRGFVRASLMSNIVAAPVDTLLFLAIAGFPITAAVVTGQLVAKLAYATLLPLAGIVIARAGMRRRRRPMTLWDQISADLGG